MKLEDIVIGQRLCGVTGTQVVDVVAVQWFGDEALSITYRNSSGGLADRLLYRTDEASIELSAEATRPFDAPAAEYRLAAEAQRIRLAGLFDPMLAVTTSAVRPLPHQIKAVYGELLPRTPLRFLLADDPGAGKTIMAGLYIKELVLRGDVQKCLIVAPGGLVEQWQDELQTKFGLRFDILTTDLLHATLDVSVFDRHPMLIARMDQLARNELLLEEIDHHEWDLVIVDEAHRMSAKHFAGKLEKTKRFLLGEKLGDRARHLLLMSATPHAGIEEDFQQFLTLLDPERFAGRYRKDVHSIDTTGLMRRMLKEELLTFEGKPLFPERRADTVPYELTPPELELYEAVTAYVREEMNRAAALDDKRKNTVGFALTVLQRRLASSPEAIYQSLVRRVARLESRRDLVANRRELEIADEWRSIDAEQLADDDELAEHDREHLEDELVDAATASQTIEEVDHEISVVRGLVSVAASVRASGTDRKWNELRSILQNESIPTGGDGHPRKIIIFTEHRDTLTYLENRIRGLLGRHDAVVSIHGGVNRHARRVVTAEFTNNPECHVLLATDAAGEGLNLQAAHLMVNYDLPWNPNRLDQRFGRIHRIGQTEVCRLWNLVADGTREGQVFQRLLDKIEEQRIAYGGKVFDVIGEAFAGRPLRDLLIEAIRYGDDPAVRARMEVTIDSSISDGLREMMEDRAVAHESMPLSDVEALREQMDEARARRLQPFYVERFFLDAFRQLGGRVSRREPGRYEVQNVPAALRDGRSVVATRYQRIVFEPNLVDRAGAPQAELCAPGHPLLDAVVDAAVARWGAALDRGTVLVDHEATEPRLLVGLQETIEDGTGSPLSRRFGYAMTTFDGSVVDGGPAPYLDYVAPDHARRAESLANLDWTAGAEKTVVGARITTAIAEHLQAVELSRTVEVDRSKRAVQQRLSQEINRLHMEALAAEDKELAGEKPKTSSETLSRRAEELEARRVRRLAELELAGQVRTRPPVVVTAALIVPLVGDVDQDEADAPPQHAVETKAVERRGVDLVLATERALGRVPEEMPFNNPGFDVRSPLGQGEMLRIEVKARIAGAEDFHVTANEVLFGKNAGDNYRLALVRVDPEGPSHDQVVYLAHPFDGIELGGLESARVTFKWDPAWSRGVQPF